MFFVLVLMRLLKVKKVIQVMHMLQVIRRILCFQKDSRDFLMQFFQQESL